MHALAALVLAAAASTAPSAVTGRWDARVVPVPEYPVAFGLEITRKGQDFAGALVNGSVKTPFTAVTFDGKELVLSLAHYDATIVARLTPAGLEGRYERVMAAGPVTIPFAASRPTRDAGKGAAASASRSLAGSWGIEMEGERQLGVFRQAGRAVEGTILTTTGDDGALHGTFDGQSLVLSAFDGIHVYRFDATLEEGGVLLGELRSRANPPVPFRARRLDEKEAASWMPGGFAMVRAKDPAAPFRFAFPDEEGRTVSSEEFAGRPMVVTIMGTWCPNCSDEAPLLVKLAKEWGRKGLAIVELAFEYTDDVPRFRRQAGRYRERHGATFPLLFAGSTAAAEDSPVIAQLTGWEGYPTTLFLDRSHRVVGAYSGFDGPATGERHARLVKEFEARVKALVAP